MPDLVNVGLAVRLKAWRLAKGVSQRELAEKIGVTPGALCHWETTGKHGNEPNYKYVTLILRELGITEQEFYRRVPKLRKRS